MAVGDDEDKKRTTLEHLQFCPEDIYIQVLGFTFTATRV
jgi:hypothetical protein